MESNALRYFFLSGLGLLVFLNIKSIILANVKALSHQKSEMNVPFSSAAILDRMKNSTQEKKVQPSSATTTTTKKK